MSAGLNFLWEILVVVGRLQVSCRRVQLCVDERVEHLWKGWMEAPRRELPNLPLKPDLLVRRQCRASMLY